MIEHDARVPRDLSLMRLDRVASALFPQYSRSRLQQWIESGELTVDGASRKSKFKVPSGALLSILAAPDASPFNPEDISLDIIHEDDSLLVVNKPAGLVVHPGAGNQTGTMLNALLFHCPTVEAVPRAGIVHRLDKDTTGLMVVAKTLESQTRLVLQLQSREVKRVYEAVVYGVSREAGEVNAAIGRNPYHRTRMSVQANGKEAITRYRTIKAYEHHTHLELSLETGRTHQIRVHMQHRGYPLVGDPAYGGTFRYPRDSPDEDLVDCLRNFPRQALHARSLSFVHPRTNELIHFESSLPSDLTTLLGLLDQQNT